jgi:hypothetical protein
MALLNQSQPSWSLAVGSLQFSLLQRNGTNESRKQLANFFLSFRVVSLASFLQGGRGKKQIQGGFLGRIGQGLASMNNTISKADGEFFKLGKFDLGIRAG